MFAVASLLLVVAISLVVSRVATVVLVATGLSRQSARFQARSALSGAGFTTSEAERVVNHPVRRRVIMVLMLIGSAGVVAAVSSLILGFRSGGAGPGWLRMLELGAGLVALVFLSRSQRVDRRLTNAIRWVLARFTDLETRDLGALLALPAGHAVAELAVREGDWLAGRTLEDLDLRTEAVIVLGIQRADGRYLGAPDGGTRVLAGDTLIVYGHAGRLHELDRRRAGGEGAHRHAEAVREGTRSEMGEEVTAAEREAAPRR